MARHHPRTIIRRDHPRRALVVRALFIVVLAGLLVSAFLLGHRTGLITHVPINDGSDDFRARVIELETRAELDKRALITLMESLANSRGVVTELEGELAFYREVMAPEELAEGVRLRMPRFIATADPLRWRYELVVQQGRPAENRFIGELRLRLQGTVLEQLEVLNLTDLDERLAREPLPINFRYFQRFEGEILLPPGFTPERVEVDVVLRKPKQKSVSVAHDWSEVMVYTS
ncbi:hypothetical protein MGP2080_05567 [marine gamma proteobacterium HTCC2080]|nr:hypothetical protein MGP2080_05567 [marine gamma proteobacterium HTCC2080]